MSDKNYVSLSVLLRLLSQNQLAHWPRGAEMYRGGKKLRKNKRNPFSFVLKVEVNFR